MSSIIEECVKKGFIDKPVWIAFKFDDDTFVYQINIKKLGDNSHAIHGKHMFKLGLNLKSTRKWRLDSSKVLLSVSSFSMKQNQMVGINNE